MDDQISRRPDQAHRIARRIQHAAGDQRVFPVAAGNGIVGRSLLSEGGELLRDGLELFVPTAEVAAGPIELAEAVEHCALDPMLGVVLKRHILRRIEFLNRIEQAEHTSVHQVVNIHMHRQILVYANGNRFHQ